MYLIHAEEVSPGFRRFPTFSTIRCRSGRGRRRSCALRLSRGSSDRTAFAPAERTPGENPGPSRIHAGILHAGKTVSLFQTFRKRVFTHSFMRLHHGSRRCRPRQRHRLRVRLRHGLLFFRVQLHLPLSAQVDFHHGCCSLLSSQRRCLWTPQGALSLDPFARLSW